MVEKKPRKIIVAIAPVGKDIETPSVNPVITEAVAKEVVACAKAGASMVHLHVRDREGNQTADLTDFSLMATAIGLGATIVRVGFEDSVFYASAKAARTNSELVEKIASLIHSIGYEVAAPTEARKLLGLN
jgi:uncharacterized protein (DUF849 family)